MIWTLRFLFSLRETERFQKQKDQTWESDELAAKIGVRSQSGILEKAWDKKRKKSYEN